MKSRFCLILWGSILPLKPFWLPSLARIWENQWFHCLFPSCQDLSSASKHQPCAKTLLSRRTSPKSNAHYSASILWCPLNLCSLCGLSTTCQAPFFLGKYTTMCKSSHTPPEKYPFTPLPRGRLSFAIPLMHTHPALNAHITGLLYPTGVPNPATLLCGLI